MSGCRTHELAPHRRGMHYPCPSCNNQRRAAVEILKYREPHLANYDMAADPRTPLKMTAAIPRNWVVVHETGNLNPASSSRVLCELLREMCSVRWSSKNCNLGAWMRIRVEVKCHCIFPLIPDELRQVIVVHGAKRGCAEENRGFRTKLNKTLRGQSQKIHSS